MENLQLSALCEIEQNNLQTTKTDTLIGVKEILPKNNERGDIQQNKKECSKQTFEFDTYIKKLNSVLSEYKMVNK